MTIDGTKSSHAVGGRGVAHGQCRSDAGFTYVEAVVSVLVVAFSLIGVYQAFGYGQGFIFKAGVRRQGLAKLHAEMESWREMHLRDPQQFRKLGAGSGVARTYLLRSTREIEASVQSELSPVLTESDLAYRDVKVRLWYAEQDLADTMALVARFYFAR